MVYYLRTESKRNELISKSKQSTITNINQETLSQLEVYLPDLAIQNELLVKFDMLLEKTMFLEARYKKKLSELSDLQVSLLQQAFNGEL